MPNHRIAVLGAGVMGVSISTLAIGHGIPVVLIDIDEEQLGRAPGTVAQQLRMSALMGSVPQDGGALVTSTSLESAREATAVIEAITEIAELKAKVLCEVSALVAPDTPIISNTSAIPINEMADSVARPEMLVGTHFMNPAYLIKTVEVIRGPRTDDAAIDAVISLLAAVDRKAIVVRDAPGFVTSRLLHPMINDAIRVVAEGTATAAAVDALMQGCLGHPTGPLRTADLIGLDNLADALSVLCERTGDWRAKPCDLLLEMVRNGRLGRKSGRGFYEYEKAQP
jgi:methoxymalonate biosynthesis protein